MLDYYKINISNEDYKKYQLEQNAKLLETLRIKGLLIENDDKTIMNYIYEDYENEFKKIILEEEDDRTINYNSANETLNEILIKKQRN